MARILLALFISLVSSIATFACAQEQEKRLALVIGNGAYDPGALQTAANDAGLIAQTLRDLRPFSSFCGHGNIF
jgi:hypothetical protein